MSMSSKLSQVLKSLINEHDLNTCELARLTGIGQPVIYRMASGETTNPKIGTLQPIASYFGISINQLIGEEPLPHHRPQGPQYRSRYRWRQLPLLTWVQAAYPGDVDRESVTDTIPCNADVGEDAYALITKDSTMQPNFPENTVLIIDPASEPTDRDFVIARLPNQQEATFKQVLFDGEDIYLKPLNQDFNVIHLSKADNYQLNGVLIEARMHFKAL